MQKTTVFLAIIGVTIIAAALIGATYAQLAAPAPTNGPWQINGNPNYSTPYCYNTTGTPQPYNNTNPQPFCYYGAETGYIGGPQACHGFGAAQGPSQYQYGGMMGGRGMMGGWGMGGRYW